MPLRSKNKTNGYQCAHHDRSEGSNGVAGIYTGKQGGFGVKQIIHGQNKDIKQVATQQIGNRHVQRTNA